LDRSLDELAQQLRASLAAYASFFGEIHDLFGDVTERLIALSSTVLVIRIFKSSSNIVVGRIKDVSIILK